MHIKVQPLCPEAKLPTFGTPSAAAADLYSCGEVLLHPGESALIPLGFAMEVPEEFAALILPRSGLGVRHGIVLGNLVGLIDSDYRQEVMVAVWNRNTEGAPYQINVGDRIAQMLISPVWQPAYEWADQLSDTQRAGGFGSTGK